MVGGETVNEPKNVERFGWLPGEIAEQPSTTERLRSAGKKLSTASKNKRAASAASADPPLPLNQMRTAR